MLLKPYRPLSSHTLYQDVLSKDQTNAPERRNYGQTSDGNGLTTSGALPESGRTSGTREVKYVGRRTKLFVVVRRNNCTGSKVVQPFHTVDWHAGDLGPAVHNVRLART